MVWAVSLSTMKLSPHSLTPGLIADGIRSLIGVDKISLIYSIQSSTSISEHPRLYLNTFRGEPAIPGFDWHFTSIHSSSDNFATLTGSDLREVLPSLHPGHG